MKILRILRRRKIKLSFIFLLLVFFIFNTYAWMSTSKNATTDSLALNISSWEVAFIIDDEEIKTEEYTFEIQEFHPGITNEETGPIIKEIDVWNIGEANSYLKYEITDIYLYGVQIYKDSGTLIPESLGAETGNEIKTANLFGNEEAQIFDANNTYYKFLEKENQNPDENKYYSFSLKYPTPFTITYSYGSTYISGKADENEPSSRSKMLINLEWNNDEANNEEDTKIGNLVYAFENAKDKDGNLLYSGEPALKIVTKVTATRDLESGGVSYTEEAQ